MGVVDGDHTFEGCYNDLVSLEKLNAQCIIVDDISYLPFLDECCKDFSIRYNYTYSSLYIYNGLGILTK